MTDEPHDQYKNSDFILDGIAECNRQLVKAVGAEIRAMPEGSAAIAFLRQKGLYGAAFEEATPMTKVITHGFNAGAMRFMNTGFGQAMMQSFQESQKNGESFEETFDVMNRERRTPGPEKLFSDQQINNAEGLGNYRFKAFELIRSEPSADDVLSYMFKNEWPAFKAAHAEQAINSELPRKPTTLYTPNPFPECDL